ncbi:hypothetical protein ACT048_24895 [Ectopseudomonas khazarica]|uniref:hypothetical protein n=1 Tax=Ectopseudomonas khazarica TaxID=2502979 RepID=UPI004034C23F
MKVITAFLAILALSFSNVMADSRPIAEHIYAISSNGQYIVDAHIESKKKVEATIRKVVGDQLIPHSKFILEGALFPKAVTISDSGIISTVDETFGRGADRAIVIYHPDGRTLKSYSIRELYSQKLVDTFAESTSGRIWRCADDLPLMRKNTLIVQDAFGGTLEVDITTGVLIYFPGRNYSQCKETATIN